MSQSNPTIYNLGKPMPRWEKRIWCAILLVVIGLAGGLSIQ